MTIEKFRDAPEGIRNVVGHKQQPETLGIQIQADPLPEPVCFRLSVQLEQCAQCLQRFLANLSGRCLQLIAQSFDGPGPGSVGCIFQYLAHNLPTHLGILATLYLHQGWDSILIHKKKINRPPIAYDGNFRQAHLPTDQQPTSRSIRLHLFTTQQDGKPGYQGL